MTTFKNAPNALYRPRRFYTTAAVTNGRITLDGKPIKTPAGHDMLLPGPVAALVAAEWQAQETWIDATQMPIQRLVNSALDRDAEDTPAIVADVLRYLETDLTLYRADQPGDLVARQSAQWDSPLARFNAQFATCLIPTSGLAVAPLGAALQAEVAQWAKGLSPIARAALGRLVGLLGSTVLAWAMMAGHLDGAGAFAAARVDNDHQSDRWGADDEAAAAAESLRAEIHSICALLAAMTDANV